MNISMSKTQIYLLSICGVTMDEADLIVERLREGSKKQKHSKTLTLTETKAQISKSRYLILGQRRKTQIIAPSLLPK